MVADAHRVSHSRCPLRALEAHYLTPPVSAFISASPHILYLSEMLIYLTGFAGGVRSRIIFHDWSGCAPSYR